MPDTRFPDFYVVGAAKAGTTSLVAMLSRHPRIYFPVEKEPHHFFLRDDVRPWTIRDGRRTLPLMRVLPFWKERDYLGLYEDTGPKELRGDASTQYLVNETTASSIHAVRDDARIIVILRDPVERAYSAWIHATARGEDDAEFSTALDECEAGLRRTSFAIDYLAEGHYAEHLARYRLLFGDRVLVVLFEDLIGQPGEVVSTIQDFLNVGHEPLDTHIGEHRNRSVALGNPLVRGIRLLAKRLRRVAPRFFDRPLVRRPYETILTMIGREPARMSDADRLRLNAYYAARNRKLGAMIGKDLSHWSR